MSSDEHQPTKTQIIRRLFGQIVVAKGFATEEDVDKALAVQKEQRKHGKRQLIGLIMLQQGSLSNEQLINILKTIDKMEKPMQI